MNPLHKSLAALVIVGGAAGAWFGATAFMRNAAFAEQQHEVSSAASRLATASDLSTAFRDVGKRLEPSVVNISVHKTVKGAGALPFDDDLLKRFFRDGNAQPRNRNNPDDEADPGDGGNLEQVGTGSGVIMETDGNTGFILTNNHVAGDASEILVTLADGRQVNGKLVGHDVKSDLAVVKISADHLIPAKWGDSSTLHKGDWIFAFGSPFGYVGSMTHGIVSALDRSNVGILGAQGYEDFIQVDAPINPGNSGGPLVDLHGEVVGINTAIASHTGAFSGIGFAIPSKEARFVYSALKERGKVVRGWLGVRIADVSRNSKLAASFGYKGIAGVLVEQALPNTPSIGKLQAGDIIESLEDKPIETVLQLRNTIATIAPNTDIKMGVFRKGKLVDVTLKLGEQPDDLTVAADENEPPHADAPAPGTADSLGMTLSDITDRLADRLNLRNRHGGALVTAVKPRSAAFKAGLRPGDLIVQIGEANVKDAAAASELLSKRDPKQDVRLYVVGPDGAHFVVIEAP